jgi:hypothetical protein
MVLRETEHALKPETVTNAQKEIGFDLKAVGAKNELELWE